MHALLTCLSKPRPPLFTNSCLQRRDQAPSSLHAEAKPQTGAKAGHRSCAAPGNFHPKKPSNPTLKPLKLFLHLNPLEGFRASGQAHCSCLSEPQKQHTPHIPEFAEVESLSITFEESVSKSCEVWFSRRPGRFDRRLVIFRQRLIGRGASHFWLFGGVEHGVFCEETRFGESQAAVCPETHNEDSSS